MSILSVQKAVDGEWKDVRKEDFKAACTDAAIHANDTVMPLRWKWALPTQMSEAAAALLFQRRRNRRPRSVNSLGKRPSFPLICYSAESDCRPDVVALDRSAFVKRPLPILACWTTPHSRTFRKKNPDVLIFEDQHKLNKGTAVREFEEWVKEQERKPHLDMTRFCWPELELTAEAKLSDLANAILQELVYMRRTQPWMRLILDLVVMTKPWRPRQHSNLSGSRQVDRSPARKTRGFELFHTKTLAPTLKSSHGKPFNTKPSKAALKSQVDVFSAEDRMMEYFHGTMAPDLTLGSMSTTTSSKTEDRWLDVAHGYFVSRETENKGDVRNFLGPCALKVYNADCGSDCYLIQLARDGQVKNVLLPTWEWYYGDALSARGLSSEVVKIYADANRGKQPTANFCPI
ncbi:hypothetical protein GGX14DRAFT_584904 [Mycena pura]|uniref:Uncharacterized protein n=1 Tax=Mycena pura TaxID=153505 RepID=A0AAD6VQF6_9AGAR|nr:hypothetical protein GGX14DRAFT_584904 [Mycena pura]